MSSSSDIGDQALVNLQYQRRKRVEDSRLKVLANLSAARTVQDHNFVRIRMSDDLSGTLRRGVWERERFPSLSTTLATLSATWR